MHVHLVWSTCRKANPYGILKGVLSTTHATPFWQGAQVLRVQQLTSSPWQVLNIASLVQHIFYNLNGRRYRANLNTQNMPGTLSHPQGLLCYKETRWLGMQRHSETRAGNPEGRDTYQKC